ncbi:hypothetical protein TNIN_220121 [Trichonephila inaurata madagascariensis]|uniref:Uncharacterized protein n=1 Tax=Trichonephila inaurata madagascariensis TaxID=2747483 RepID=A0A8X7CBZ9_9ARAC|nr:hypothetical protein TNIN_220121 [Trichonephila inaurata madagascariensis]
MLPHNILLLGVFLVIQQPRINLKPVFRLFVLALQRKSKILLQLFSDDCAAKFSSTIRNQGHYALRASLERRRGRLDESRENVIFTAKSFCKIHKRVLVYFEEGFEPCANT